MLVRTCEKMKEIWIKDTVTTSIIASALFLRQKVDLPLNRILRYGQPESEDENHGCLYRAIHVWIEKDEKLRSLCGGHFSA